MVLRAKEFGEAITYTAIVSNCEQAHPEKAFILATGVESGPGFCRFPGLDSTEAERPSGESRFPFPVRDFLRNLSPESALTSKR
jgi:hypothetical protein